MALDHPSEHVKAARPHSLRILWLSAAAVFALGRVGDVAYCQGPTCIPATMPCQTCPAPPPCTPSNKFICGPLAGATTTFTTSTVTCAGSFAQETVTLESTVGPANICIGPNKGVGCFVLAGTTNINTNTDIITAPATAAIPTLSVWAFGFLAVLLGALALRRLRRLGPA